MSVPLWPYSVAEYRHQLEMNWQDKCELILNQVSDESSSFRRIGVTTNYPNFFTIETLKMALQGMGRVQVETRVRDYIRHGI